MAKRKPTRRSVLKAGGAAIVGGLAGAAPLPGCSKPPAEPDATDQRAPEDELLTVAEALFRPTAKGCTVHWIPNGALEARVLTGIDPTNLTPAYQETTDGPTQVMLDGFPPSSTAFLQLQYRRPNHSEWIVRPVRRIQTARKPQTSFRVAIIADSHLYAHRQRAGILVNLQQTLAAAVRDEPDFVIWLGDEAGIHFVWDEAGSMSQTRAHQRWRFWRRQCADLLAAVPSFMILGNHEGEAGYYQSHAEQGGKPGYLQRWATIARKRVFLNPLPSTYAEGGENEAWTGDPNSEATGGGADGNASPLQNYYAWTWGDALFIVLDVHRYTNPGGKTPRKVEQWTLGETQLRWFEKVLASSDAPWKLVLAHHLVGGSEWDLSGKNRQTDYKYGRGGAPYARVGEQSRITDLMNRHAARFFLYGHDHVFAHQQAEDIHFVCCGRPTFLSSRWWSTPGWQEAYGKWESRDPHDFYAALGYTRLTVGPDDVRFEYVRTAVDSRNMENVDAPLGGVVHRFEVSAS